VRWRADGDALRLEVQDSGPGLDAGQQSRLFQAFERLGMHSAGIEGLGIGLALSKWLVELMKGEIGVHSEPGVGSTFWLRLARPAGPAPARPAAAEVPAAPREVPPRSVLYIEDNEVNQILMQGMLAQRPGLQLHLASLPETGLAIARETRPALVLLDIQLPGIDGFEVQRRLRSDPATRDIPVVAVSANAMPADVAEAAAAGFADYITKPLDLQRLLAVVDRVLGA
jgi:CheY-like chemotaxis protein